MTANDERRSRGKLARRRMTFEALVLFAFAWVATIVTSLFRPPVSSPANLGFFQFIGSTFVTALECFAFGYVLSRFFKQFKTGCAFVIILFFAYLIWVGRRP